MFSQGWSLLRYYIFICKSLHEIYMVSKGWEHPWSATKALMLQRQLSQFRGKSKIMPAHPTTKQILCGQLTASPELDSSVSFRLVGQKVYLSEVNLSDYSPSSEHKCRHFSLLPRPVHGLSTLEQIWAQPVRSVGMVSQMKET